MRLFLAFKTQCASIVQYQHIAISGFTCKITKICEITVLKIFQSAVAASIFMPRSSTSQEGAYEF